MTPPESEKLLDDLTDFACQAPRTYKHSWTPGDLVVWDNRCFLHRGCRYDPIEPRRLRGTRVAGDIASETGDPEGSEEQLAVAMDYVKQTEQWLTSDDRLR